MASHIVRDSSGYYTATLDWDPQARHFTARAGASRISGHVDSLKTARAITYHWLHAPFATAAEYGLRGD